MDPIENVSVEPPDPNTRPPRPVPVDFASAILIIGGITSLAGLTLGRLLVRDLPSDAGLLPIVVVVLDVAAIAAGFLVLRGRYWRLSFNIVAISILLYLIALPNPIAFLYLLMYLIVFYGLTKHRRWFSWSPPDGNAIQ